MSNKLFVIYSLILKRGYTVKEIFESMTSGSKSQKLLMFEIAHKNGADPVESVCMDEAVVFFLAKYLSMNS